MTKKRYSKECQLQAAKLVVEIGCTYQGGPRAFGYDRLINLPMGF